MSQKNPMEKRIQQILGQTDEDLELKQLAENQRKMFIVAESIEKKLKESLKPRGYYNIPELLDSRRLEYLIPNGAFESYPGFDKVYIWQISTKESNTYAKGGQIVMPDNILAAKKNTAPKGIIVSAGLKAMDALYSTGFELGHIVYFKKFAPFVLPIEEIDGHELTVMLVRDGDIESSVDVATSLHSRKGQIKNVSIDAKSYDFRYVLDGVATGEKIPEYYDPSV
jgi:hypothetical protein